MVTEPFTHWAGPRDARMVLLGEAFGEKEELSGQPFAGSSGQELFSMLGEAMPEVEPGLHAEITSQFRFGLNWLRRRNEWLFAARVAFTNTLNFRPPKNSLEAICVKKGDLPSDYPLPPLSLGHYLPPDVALPELDRLKSELAACSPNLVVLCGNTACWAMLRSTTISAIRGNAAQSVEIDARGTRLKVLPTYHPAAVMRQWSWRPIVVADLMKAHREAGFAEIRRPARSILVDPSIEEVEAWVSETLAAPPPLMACDTETAIGQITMISFARSRSEAMLVPFIDRRFPGRSYWPAQALEERAWAAVEALLASSIPKVFQNGLYDYQYILPLGLRVQNLAEDSMLRHHSILPEMKKGLGFLASVYTSEPTWKTMRLDKADTEKRDE